MELEELQLKVKGKGRRFGPTSRFRGSSARAFENFPRNVIFSIPPSHHYSH